MAGTKVYVLNGVEYRVPADATLDEVDEYIKATSQPPVTPGPEAGYPSRVMNAALGAITGAVTGAYGLGKRLLTMPDVDPTQAIRLQADLGRALIEPQWNLLRGGTGQMAEELKGMVRDPSLAGAGRYGSALAQTALGLTPVIGPTAARKAEQVAAGQIPEAIGETGAEALMTVLPVALGKIKLNPTAILNPVERKAIEWAIKNDVPIDLATGTQNPFYQGAKSVIERLPGAAAQGRRFVGATQARLQEIGKGLATQAAPLGRESALKAGSDLIGSANDVLTQAIIPEQQERYTLLNQLAQTKGMQRVQTGVRQSSALNAQGNPIMEPIFEDIAAPVNKTELKAALKPEYERLSREIPLAKQAESPGYTALKQIMESPDIVSLQQAIDELSPILKAARTRVEGAATPSQRIANLVAEPYRREIDRAALQLGKTMHNGIEKSALDLLNEGRTLTKQKWELEDFVSIMAKEPGQVVRTLVKPRDASVDALTRLSQYLPGEMPTLGRALIEDILTESTNVGTLRGMGALRSWSRIGPETKRILFKDPNLISDLDNFFNAAKLVSTPVNPSHSGTVLSLAQAGLLVARDPFAGVPYLIGMRQASNIMYGEGGARLLARALRQNVNSAGGADTAMRLYVLTKGIQQPLIGQNPQ